MKTKGGLKEKQNKTKLLFLDFGGKNFWLQFWIFLMDGSASGGGCQRLRCEWQGMGDCSCRTVRPDGVQGRSENSGNSNDESPQRAFRELADMLGILEAIAISI